MRNSNLRRHTLYMVDSRNRVLSQSIGSRSGVTLVELLLVAACFVCGVVIALRAGDTYGVLGYFGGFALGFVAPFAVVAAIGLTVAYLIGALTGIPEYPVCAAGKCHSRDAPNSDYRYEWDEAENRLIARCQCGTPYVKRGRRFFRLGEEGSLTPYMIWKPLRGWFTDDKPA